MDGLILAVEGCDYVNEVVCKPDNVLEFFEFPALFGDISRTIFLIALAALIDPNFAASDVVLQRFNSLPQVF